MLFVKEAPLDGPIRGTSTFAGDFSEREPRDGRGRSLRELDLERRLFRYPMSFLIYSEAFDALPAVARELFARRLVDVLSGDDRSEAFIHLSDEDRGAILEILQDTKPELLEMAR